MKRDWYLLKSEEVIKALDTSKKGLSSDEALKRLLKYGKNELPKKKQKTFMGVLLSQFKSPIVYILFIAMLLSLVVGEYTDALFIFVVVIADALLGAVQEYRSNKNAEHLSSLIKMEATIIRDGKLRVVDSSELVIGDIVVLESGDKVSADLRLIETQNLSIDESILTGESIPREKKSGIINENTIINDRFNTAFVGTNVMRGRGKGVVIATGADTEIGKIAKEVLESDESESPLQVRMNKFTRQIGLILAILALVVSFILYYKNYATRDVFFLVVALSVSAIPEGLPVVITLALSISSNKMAKKNVIVKKLNAVEALGSATVIATDKTGTLTLNEQTVKKIILASGEEYDVTGIGYNDKGEIVGKYKSKLKTIIKEGVLNNEASLVKVKGKWVSLGDSMDIALLSLGYKYKLKNKESVIGRIPYESEAAYSCVFYEESGNVYVSAKGSVEKILKLCKNAPKKEIRKKNNYLASSGYRVLAFASGEVKRFKKKELYSEKDLPKLEFLGLIAFVDPIRDDAIEAVKTCELAGIKVVMITGDHPLTAYSIGKELGICTSENEVVIGEELDKYRLEGDSEFDKFIKDKKIFARVSPVQKLEIVSSFKRMGEFIAVTGDGVNDAPALKAANVSVAMGSGTDVAKETGSLIITDDKFSSIVKGVKEGRCAYSNVRKVIHMLLSCGVCEVVFYLFAILLNYSTPLTAVQLLWLNLVTDGLQDVALAAEKGEKDLMKDKPRKTSEGIFDRLLVNEIVLNGLVMGICVFGLWVYLNDVKHLDITTARTYTLILMVFIQNVHCFNCRSEKLSIFKKPLRENKYLLFGILGVLLLQIVVMNVPVLANILGITTVSLKDAVILIALTIPIIVSSELLKYFERERRV